MGFNPYFQYKPTDPMSHFVEEKIPIDLIMANLKDRQTRQDIETAKLDKIAAYNLKTGTENDKKTLDMYRKQVINPFVDELYNTDKSVGNSAQRIAKFVGDISNDPTLNDIASRAVEMEEYNKTKQALIAQGKLNKDYEYFAQKKLGTFEGLDAANIFKGVDGKGAIGMQAAGAIERRPVYEQIFNDLKPKIIEQYDEESFRGLMQYIRTGTATISMDKIDEMIRLNINAIKGTSAGEQEKWYYDRLVDEGAIDPGKVSFDKHMENTLRGVGKEFLRSDYSEAYDAGLNAAFGGSDEEQPAAPLPEAAVAVGSTQADIEKLQESLTDPNTTDSEKQTNGYVLNDFIRQFEETPNGRLLGEGLDNSLAKMTDETFIQNSIEGLTYGMIPYRGKTKEQTREIVDKLVRKVTQLYANYAGPSTRTGNMTDVLTMTSVTEAGVSPRGLPEGVRIPLSELGLTPDDLGVFGVDGAIRSTINQLVSFPEIKDAAENLYHYNKAFTGKGNWANDGFMEEGEKQVSWGKVYVLSEEKARKEAENLFTTSSVANNYKIVGGDKDYDLSKLQNESPDKITVGVVPNNQTPRLQITTEAKRNANGEVTEKASTFIVEPQGDWMTNGRLVHLYHNTLGSTITGLQMSNWGVNDVVMPGTGGEYSLKPIVEMGKIYAGANISPQLTTRKYNVSGEVGWVLGVKDLKGKTPKLSIQGGQNMHPASWMVSDENSLISGGSHLSIVGAEELFGVDRKSSALSVENGLNILVKSGELTQGAAANILEAYKAGNTDYLPVTSKQKLNDVLSNTPFLFLDKRSFLDATVEFNKMLSF